MNSILCPKGIHEQFKGVEATHSKCLVQKFTFLCTLSKLSLNIELQALTLSAERIAMCGTGEALVFDKILHVHHEMNDKSQDVQDS